MTASASSTTFQMLKTIQWERTKGELRAMGAVLGSYMGDEQTQPRQHQYNDAIDRIEDFIKDFEAEGLEE